MLSPWQNHFGSFPNIDFRRILVHCQYFLCIVLYTLCLPIQCCRNSVACLWQAPAFPRVTNIFLFVLAHTIHSGETLWIIQCENHLLYNLGHSSGVRSRCWRRPRICREVGYLWWRRSVQVKHFFCSLPMGRWEWLQQLQGAGFAQAGITAQLWTWGPLPCSEPGKSWAEPPSSPLGKASSASVILGIPLSWKDTVTRLLQHLSLSGSPALFRKLSSPLPNECLAHHAAGNALFILWFAAISRTFTLNSQHKTNKPGRWSMLVSSLFFIVLALLAVHWKDVGSVYNSVLCKQGHRENSWSFLAVLCCCVYILTSSLEFKAIGTDTRFPWKIDNLTIQPMEYIYSAK